MSRKAWVALLFLFTSSAGMATSFGPIPLVKQLENTAYVVHGRISSAAWIMEERVSRRPYTHWKLRVLAVPKGDALPEEITIRQPGGELGGVGYHVAGTATFREGEEVFVNLQDTDEPNIKDVTGLTSGKFSVSNGANGREVTSGFGATMREQGGRAFSPESFTRFVQRVRDNRATEADQTVYVNQGISHAGAEESDHAHGPVPTPKLSTPPLSSASPAGKNPAYTATEPPPTLTSPTSPQESPSSAEEPEGSSTGWWIVGVVFALLTGGSIWLFRRR